MTKRSGGYINRDGRVAGGGVCVTRRPDTPDLKYDPAFQLREDYRPERIKMEVSGPVAAVMRLWDYLFNKQNQTRQ